jgi:hypothetical protein
MRYELTDYERIAIRSMLPNKPALHCSMRERSLAPSLMS